MTKPGDVGTMLFPGARGAKRRPVVVVSNVLYHSQHLDVIVGAVTTNLAIASSASDYRLLDWQQAGLNLPSAFRRYLLTTEPANINFIGRLTDRDWNGVVDAVRQAFT